MRYILDDLGYIEEVSFYQMVCNDKTCTEYTGTIPEGYETLEEWAKNANIRAYKIVDGNLTYDSDRDTALQEEWSKCNDNQVLWDAGDGNGYYMFGSQTVNLSQKVSEQKNGIVLIWQGYKNGAVQTYDFNFEFIPKSQVVFNPGKGISCLLADSTGSVIGTKYVYVNDDRITGNNANSNGATKRDSGITTTNNRWVLTKVLGV